MNEAISTYLKSVERALKRDDATEHTHRAALQKLLEALMPKVEVVNEPKRIKCGAPDLIVAHGPIPLGYVEAKDVGVPLDPAEKSKQLKAYRESLGNLILTDYLEFRWYVDGERRLSARLADWDGKRLTAAKDAAEFLTLVSAFRDAQIPTIAQAKELARRMAALTRLIRDSIRGALAEEKREAPENGKSLAEMPIHGQLQGFREVLIADLPEDEFADMYAQTIAYGLFAARFNRTKDETFTREWAQFHMPASNPFLAKTFVRIGGVDLDQRVAWAVDDLAELLNRTDFDAILSQFRGPTRRDDPVVHFYETFLAEYDPTTRERRGVYYTPGPVVSYMVRSVDEILKRDFGLERGLADASLLDDGKTAQQVAFAPPALGPPHLGQAVQGLRHQGKDPSPDLALGRQRRLQALEGPRKPHQVGHGHVAVEAELVLHVAEGPHEGRHQGARGHHDVPALNDGGIGQAGLDSNLDAAAAEPRLHEVPDLPLHRLQAPRQMHGHLEKAMVQAAHGDGGPQRRRFRGGRAVPGHGPDHTACPSGESGENCSSWSRL